MARRKKRWTASFHDSNAKGPKAGGNGFSVVALLLLAAPVLSHKEKRGVTSSVTPRPSVLG